jgi:hypothetical protein
MRDECKTLATLSGHQSAEVEAPPPPKVRVSVVYGHDYPYRSQATQLPSRPDLTTPASGLSPKRLCATFRHQSRKVGGVPLGQACTTWRMKPPKRYSNFEGEMK